MAKKIACRTGGVYRGVKDNEDAALAIRMYYEGLAKSFRRDETVWSEPYLDSMGLGLVTTAARVRSTCYGVCMPCFVEWVIGCADRPFTRGRMGTWSASLLQTSLSKTWLR